MKTYAMMYSKKKLMIIFNNLSIKKWRILTNYFYQCNSSLGLKISIMTSDPDFLYPGLFTGGGGRGGEGVITTSVQTSPTHFWQKYLFLLVLRIRIKTNLPDSEQN